MALFEAFKGVFVLGAGLGLLELMHHNLEKAGEQLLSQIGINPHSEYPRTLLHLLSEINDSNIRLVAFFAFFYALIRFSEAYGLWRGADWAKWLGIISGGIYLPFEFYELARQFTVFKLAITLINIAVVVYLVRVKLTDTKLV